MPYNDLWTVPSLVYEINEWQLMLLIGAGTMVLTLLTIVINN